jgi:hypothetical protein
MIPKFRCVARAGFVVSAIAFSSVVASASMPESLLRAVPKDAVLAYFAASPNTDGPNTQSSLGLATFVIERAQEFGLLSKLNERPRMWADVLASMSELLDYPHAGVLLDISAAPRPDGGHQLSGLHAALIIRTRTQGGGARIGQRIQHLLSSYTNDENSTLSSHISDGSPVFTLRDRRLPDWVELTWGTHGEDYIVAIGAGSFDRIVQTIADQSLSLADDAWFTNAWKVAGGPDASLTALLRFDIARSAADDSLRSKFEHVQENLRLGGVDRGLWTVGRRARAIEAGAFLRRGNGDEWQPITRREDADFAPGVIPDEATWYAIYDVEPRALVDTVSKTYLASKSPHAQDKNRTFWRKAEERVGLSIDGDILALLRQPIVSHNYPQHALRLPLAWTRLIAVADPDALRRNLDRVLEAAREELAKEGPTQLRHDADGVWYLYLGIAGPALTVADRWLIVSFSPDAVRKNVEMLSRRRSVTTTPVPTPVQP